MNIKIPLSNIMNIPGSNGFLQIKEKFDEALSISGRPAGIGSNDPLISVRLDINKIYWWLENVPQQGAIFKADPFKKGKLKTAINNNCVIDSPIIWSMDDTCDQIRVSDGRHRLCLMCELGASYAVAMIPTSQNELIQSCFASMGNS